MDQRQLSGGRLELFWSLCRSHEQQRRSLQQNREFKAEIRASDALQVNRFHQRRREPDANKSLSER